MKLKSALEESSRTNGVDRTGEKMLPVLSCCGGVCCLLSSCCVCAVLFVLSSLVQSSLVVSCLVRVLSCPVLSGLVLSGLVLSCQDSCSCLTQVGTGRFL